MGQIFGIDIGISAPKISLTGLGHSWIYIVIIALIGLLLIIGVVIILFMNTYKRKVVFFENIAGAGYQPILKTRARVIKLGRGGEEVLKTLAGGTYISAYGRKMGKRTYWYARGQDGYWYNIILGDLDAKFSILDIEPVDRDVRMFHLGIDKIAQNDYAQKRTFLEKYGIHMMVFIFLVIFLIGLIVISGKINEGLKASSNPEIAKTNQETANILSTIATKLDNIQRGIGDSGLIPANINSTGGG